MICAIKNEEDLKDLKEEYNLRSNVKQVRLVEKLGKQGYHFHIKELFEPVINTIKKYL